MKDKSGRELRPGDLIVYGHLLGRSAGLKYGKVMGTSISSSEWSPKVTEKLRIRAASGWSQNSLSGRDSFLSYGDRIVKIDRAQVEPGLLALLDTVQP